MKQKETPEERRERLAKQLEKARRVAKERREEAKKQKEAGTYVEQPRKRRPKNLDKIVREVLDDDELVDKVIANQPEYWGRLPVKNGGYIIATVMMVKAMSGEVRAAEWIRKTGFGDKVLLEGTNGFFDRQEFMIKVVPSKNLDSGDDIKDVLSNETKQIEG